MVNPATEPLGRNAAQRMTQFELPSRKLSVKEAAAYLGLSVSTLNKLRLSGKGPRYLKLGRRVLYDIRDLESWVAERTRSHTSEQS